MRDQPELVSATTVVVTGAAGFIGSHLCVHLADAGFSVIAVDAAPGWRRHLRDAVERRTVEFVETGQRWPYVVPPAVLERADAIVHLAYAEPDSSSSEVAQEVDLNLRPTLDLIDAVPATVRRFVFASTALVYGRGRVGRSSEELPVEPDAPYPLAKVAVEQALAEWCDGGEHTSVALRFATVYGPAETVPRAAPNFIRALLAGDAPTIGVADDARDYVHVRDVCHAIERSLVAPLSGFCAVNVGTGVRTTTLELARQCIAAVGAPGDVEPRVTGGNRGPVEVVVCPERARVLLGFEAEIDLATGLPSEVAWFRSAGVAAC